MNNRNAELNALMETEKRYQQLVCQEWNKKIAIYADMLFTLDTEDLFDLLTGSMAYTFGFFSLMLANTPPEGFGNVCIDPSTLAQSIMLFGGTSIFFGAMHMLYQYPGYNKQELDRANLNIKHYTERKLEATNKRYTLFPETNRSFVSSTIESARKLFRL